MSTTSNVRIHILRAAAAFAVAIALLPATPTSAVEFPLPSSPLFFQTSGPNAGLNIGDWYTSTAGDATNHQVLLHVPAAWPAGRPVTVAVYDPESRGGSTGLATNDEVRGPADVTRFTLTDPTAGTLVTEDFASSTAYHGRWVEILTFVPTPGTAYRLTTETGIGASADNQRNDDNSWRLSFTSDPDCAIGQPVGTCVGIESGNETDDPDATAGTGDELAIGFQRATYQYSSRSTIDFWFHVDATADASVTLHNFDLDNNGAVTYHRANGTTVTGTVSGTTSWNNGSSTARGGDVVSTAGSTGWWRAEIEASGNNQFVFEVSGQVPVYFQQPPTPVLAVTIDDADVDIAEGEPHTYVITVENESDTTGAPGAAVDTTVTVPLPAGVVFDGCTAPSGVTCAESGGTVTFSFPEPFPAGADATLGIDLTGGPGMPATVDLTATARYEDQLGNRAVPGAATDSDLTRYPDTSVTITPDTIASPGSTVVLDVAVTNGGDHIQPGTTVDVPVPDGASIDGAGTDAAWSCPDGAVAPTVCTWTLGTMAPSAAATAAIALSLPNAIGAGIEALDVDAAVGGDYAEVVLDNNADTATITVDAVPDLAITVVPPAEYVPGTQAGWSVTVDNLGDQDASGVVATVTVPVDADATPATGWTCVPDAAAGSTCTYPIGDLAAGATTVLPFPVDTDPAAVDDATLVAAVADDGAGGPETNVVNNTDDDTVTPDPEATLTMVVTVTVDPVNVGDPAEFTFTAGNLGPSVSTSTAVVVDVPAGLGGASLPAGCSVIGTDTWLCVAGTLAPGETATFATSGTADHHQLTLTATAASPTAPLTASDSATTTANRPPVAGDASTQTDDRDPVAVPVPADDPDGDDLIVTVTTADGTATVVDGPGGPQIVYTPDATTAGTVTLGYEACDPDGLCDTGVVDVLVRRVFLTATPMCVADAAYLAYEATVVGVAGDPTATVTWSDGVTTSTAAGLPLDGLALWPGMAVDDASKAPADRVATDWPGWYLDDGIWVAGDDGFAWARGPVEVTVTVNPTSDPVSVTYPLSTVDCAADPTGPANRPPTGTDLEGWASARFPYTVDLLAGTGDPDGDPVTITTVTPSSGAAAVVDGVLTYTPAPGDAGRVVLDVEVTDGRGAFTTFRVTIDIVAARDMSGVAFVDADGDGVVDDGEAPVADAAVTVTHPGPDGVAGTSDDIVLGTRTGLDGTWSIDDVPAGEVTVEVDASGRPAVVISTTDDVVVTAFDEQLPVTGADLARIASIAAVLVGIGLLALVGTGRRDEEETA